MFKIKEMPPKKSSFFFLINVTNLVSIKWFFPSSFSFVRHFCFAKKNSAFWVLKKRFGHSTFEISGFAGQKDVVSVVDVLNIVNKNANKKKKSFELKIKGTNFIVSLPVVPQVLEQLVLELKLLRAWVPLR